MESGDVGRDTRPGGNWDDYRRILAIRRGCPDNSIVYCIFRKRDNLAERELRG